MTFDLSGLVYKPLDGACPRTRFRCGEDALDRWFRRESERRHESHKCKVTTVHVGDAPEPIGFYAMGIILETERLHEKGAPILTRAVDRVYPALHLEYLAVDREFQGKGVGTDMLVRVLEIYRRAVMDMGVPILTLVPINDGLVPFYRDRGFVPYAQQIGERRMMLPAQSVIDMYEKAMAEGGS